MQKPLITCKFSGRKGDIYTTLIYETFDDCNCPGFNFRKNCKHVEKLKKFYNLKNQKNGNSN